MVTASSKQRYEIVGGRIRARYGHSIPTRVLAEPRLPPTLLFHGTAPATVPVVLTDGLRPMGRQYVHLSVDVQTARAVGARKARPPVVLQVSAEQAARDGVTFYVGNEQVWLADFVPARYLTPWAGKRSPLPSASPSRSPAPSSGQTPMHPRARGSGP